MISRRKRMMQSNNSGGTLRQQLLDGAPGATPLLHTVVPTRGSLTPSFTRATTETGQKYDSAGYLDFTALSGEVIFKGAMRIENLWTFSEDNTNAAYTQATVTTTASTVVYGAGEPTQFYRHVTGSGTAAVAVGSSWQAQVKVSGVAGNKINFYIMNGAASRGAAVQITLSTTPTVYSLNYTATNAEALYVWLMPDDFLGLTNGTFSQTVTATQWQSINITGETDQTTIRPYVSVGVLSAPAYHGSCVDGVKCYPTDLNGNPIPRTGTYPLVGYVPWEARTNHFKNSGTPATQTSGSLGTGTYTLWMTGTGSIAVAGTTATITGAGTATAGTPVTFVVTVAGTVTYTVTGSPTKAQSENGAFPTPYIITAGAAVARNADILTYTGAEIANYKAMATALSRGAGISSAGEVLALSNNTANEYSGISLTSATALKFDGVAGGVAQWATTASNAYTPATNAKAAVSVATNSIKMDFNATAQTEDTSATAPAYTQVHVGHLNGASVFNGPVTDLYFWTRNLSQSELGAVNR